MTFSRSVKVARVKQREGTYRPTEDLVAYKNLTSFGSLVYAQHFYR